MWLFLLFLAIPLIEIALFIQIGGLIGLWPTLLIVILTAIAGTWLVRSQGMMALGQVQQSFSSLRDPTEPLAHGAMILFAGALLLTPGFFTDFVGFSLLIPAVRLAVMRYAKGRIQTGGVVFTSHEPPSQRVNPDVIDAEIVEPTQSNPGSPGDSGWTKH